MYNNKSLYVLSLAALAAAKTIDVKVGNGELKFNPDSATAEKGDIINFAVYHTHNVAQSTFDSPCKPSGDNAIYSGYMDSTFNFMVTVNDTNPAWFYCGTGDHCSDGMVFAINPTSDKTVAMYADKAKDAGEGMNPQSVNGGVIGSGGSSGSAMTSGGSSMTSGGSSPTGSATMGGSSASGSSSSPSPTSSGSAGSKLSSDYLVGLPVALWALGLFFE